MRRIFICAVSLLMAAIVVSCDEKQAALDELRDMAKELNDNAENMKAEDWEQAAIVYANIDSILSANDYTEEELKEIGRLQGECLGYFTKRSIKKVKEEAKKAASQVKGIFEGFKDAMEED